MKGKKAILVFVLGLVVLSYACANEQAAGLHLKSGIAYLESRQYTPALKELLEAEKQNPDDPQIHYYLGVLYHVKRLQTESIREFERAISLKPDYAEAHNYLGLIYDSAGRYDDAILSFKKAASNLLYETPSFAWNNMGWSYFKKGNYEEALKAFSEALKQEPNTYNHPAFETNMGRVYLKMGQTEKAAIHFSRAVKIAPDYLEARYWLGKCYQAQNKRGAALKEFQAILAASPDSESALKAKEEIDLLSKPVNEGK